MYERYVELLNENHCKSADVAKTTGIHPSIFSDWKKGKSSPKYDKIQKIAEFFGVEPDWLSGKSEFKTKKEIVQHRFGKDAVRLLDYYTRLNDTGKKKALETLEDMTDLPKYTE